MSINTADHEERKVFTVHQSEAEERSVFEANAMAEKWECVDVSDFYPVVVRGALHYTFTVVGSNWR